MTGLSKKKKLCTSICFDFPVYGKMKTCGFKKILFARFFLAGFSGNSIELALLLQEVTLVLQDL